MIERSNNDGIVNLRLAHGKASALDVELLDGLARVIAEIALDDGVRAVILTGTGSIFSAGVDLFRLTNAGDEYVSRFVPALSRLMLDLFSFPKPLVDHTVRLYLLDREGDVVRLFDPQTDVKEIAAAMKAI